MIIAKSIGDKYTAQMNLEGNDKVKVVYAGQPVELDGTGEDMRPGQLLLSGYAACINITARQLLNKENLSYDDVIVSVDMDNSQKGKTKFFSKVEIISDTVSQEKKDEIINTLKDCAVCKILANEKEFLDLV